MNAYLAFHIRQFYLLVTSTLAIQVYGATIAAASAILWILWARKRLKHVSALSTPTNQHVVSISSRLWKHFGIIQVVLAILFVVNAVAFVLVPHPSIVYPRLPIFEPIPVSDVKPLTIAFDRPVSKSITASITPDVEGAWVNKPTLLNPWVTDQITFIPRVSLHPDTEYLVEIENLTANTLDTKAKGAANAFLFRTPALGSISRVNVEEGQQDVPVDQSIVVEFEGSQSDAVDWSATLEPSTPLEVTMSENRAALAIVPETDLQHDTQYTLTVTSTPFIVDYETGETVERLQSQQVHELTFRTARVAGVDHITPQGSGTLPSAALIIEFAQPMNTNTVEDALTITPETEGSIVWTSDHVMQFFPTPSWQLATAHTVRISQDARSADGGKLENEITNSFSTIGDVQVQSASPTSAQTSVSPNAEIRITFDQPVDKQEAQDAFNISPSTDGTFSWNGNTMIFTPARQLSFATVYTLRIDAGVNGLFDTTMTEAFTSSFTTSSQTTMLNLPYFKQHYSFTCFSAASQMVLAYYGITVSELGFLDEIGRDTTKRNFVTNTWGNPNTGVVGSYDGSGDGGYGAHWDPVARAISKYRPTEVKRNWNIPDLLTEVERGYPVMVWWVNGIWPTYDASWNTPSGERVYTVNGMHVNVVKGWVGDKQNPTSIITSDPSRGVRYIPPSQFLSLWKWFDNTAVVVR